VLCACVQLPLNAPEAPHAPLSAEARATILDAFSAAFSPLTAEPVAEQAQPPPPVARLSPYARPSLAKSAARRATFGESALTHVLSVPLCMARLRRCGIDPLVALRPLLEPAGWARLLREGGAALKSGGAAVPDVRTPGGWARSFSWLDAERERQPADQREASDSDSDDEQPAAKRALVPRFRPAAGEAWLLGNVVELVLSDETGGAVAQVGDLFALLHWALSKLSSHDLTVSADTHPDYAAQLGLLRGPKLLQSAMVHLVAAGPRGVEAAAGVCGLLDRLIEMTPKNEASHMLNAMVFKTDVLPLMWQAIAAAEPPTGAALATSTTLPLFCSAFAHLLFVQDDHEFFEQQRPFSTAEVVKMVALFNRCLLEVSPSPAAPAPAPAYSPPACSLTRPHAHPRAALLAKASAHATGAPRAHHDDAGLPRAAGPSVAAPLLRRRRLAHGVRQPH
jgi:hypothetical protein